MALFSKKNLAKAPKCLKDLDICLRSGIDFLIMGNPGDELIVSAESMGYQVINVPLHNINPDLIGTRVIGNVLGIPIASPHVAWADSIIEHPEQKFLVVFYIKDAKPQAIDALKSFIKTHSIQRKHADNFLVGVVSSKEIQSTILPLLTRIDWVD